MEADGAPPRPARSSATTDHPLYYDRYRLPVMHTETNLNEGPRGTGPSTKLSGSGGPACSALLQRRRAIVELHLVLAHRPGRPGTSRSAARRGTVNPLGLCDLDRNLRAVGRACKTHPRWRRVLPTQSACLRIARGAPERHRQTVGRRGRRDAQNFRERAGRPTSGTGGES